MREFAYKLLGKSGGRAVPFLLKALEAQPERARAILGAAHAIGAAADRFVQPQMQLYRASEDPIERSWLLRTMPSYGRRGIVALELLGGQRDVIGPILVGALSSSDAATRRAAARALVAVRFAPQKVLPVVRKMVRSPDARDHRWAVVAFLNLLPTAEPTVARTTLLGELMLSEPAATRRQLVRAMGRMASWGKEVLLVLSGALHDPDASVRRAAATATGKWGAAARPSRGVLAKLVEDEAPAVREAATLALEKLR